jgi:hypothetical protein
LPGKGKIAQGNWKGQKEKKKNFKPNERIKDPLKRVSEVRSTSAPDL